MSNTVSFGARNKESIHLALQLLPPFYLQHMTSADVSKTLAACIAVLLNFIVTEKEHMSYMGHPCPSKVKNGGL